MRVAITFRCSHTTGSHGSESNPNRSWPFRGP
jgi:hypothetical protein